MIFRISRALGRDRAELDELLERELVLLELADGERRAVDRQRRHDDVDARAVGQARVADRRGFVDAAADLADDALADVEELLVVAEADAGLLDLAGDFDVHRARAVHHDVGDVVAREQRLERAVAEHVVADVVEQLFLLGDRHHDVLDRDDLVDDVADFLARGVGIEPRELGEIDRLDQRAEDRALDLVVGLGAPRIGRDRRRRCRVLCRRRAAAKSAARRARQPASAQRPARCAAAAAAAGVGAGGGDVGAAPARARRRGGLAPDFLSARLPNTLHDPVSFTASCAAFCSSGVSRPRFGFFTSARPVRTCASCRNISAVLMAGGHFGDHLAVIGGGAEQLRLERNARDRLVVERLGEIGRLDLRPLRHADLVEADRTAAVVRPRRLAGDR